MSEVCTLLDEDVTAADYEQICLDSANRLCGAANQAFVDGARECLKHSGCGDFGNCFIPLTETFNESSNCIGACIGM